MEKNELKTFVKENSPWIYEYINTEVLKDIGELNPNYFITLIEEFFGKDLDEQNLTFDTFPYLLFSEVLGEARKPYTFFRKETMSLTKLYKEVSVYYNYVRFSIKDEFFCIDLIQTKMGVTSLDEELVKFSKQFAMNTTSIQGFIEKNKNYTLNVSLKEIKDSIDNIL